MSEPGLLEMMFETMRTMQATARLHEEAIETLTARLEQLEDSLAGDGR